MMSCQKSLLAFACLVLLQATGVRANEGDVLNLSATLSSMRDDNLFRLAPSVDPKSVGLDGKSDTITTMALGLNFNKLFGLQRLIANVSLVDNRYKTNDYLDFQALNYDAKWLWAVGTRWTGELAVDRNESLNSFSDYRNFRVRNVRTIENERFSANYWFHSNWAAVVGVSRYSLTNEQPFLADSDYDANGYKLRPALPAAVRQYGDRARQAPRRHLLETAVQQHAAVRQRFRPGQLRTRCRLASDRQEPGARPPRVPGAQARPLRRPRLRRLGR